MIFEEVRLNWKIGNASGHGSPVFRNHRECSEP